MSVLIHPLLRCGVAILALSLLSGCVSAKYKSAPKSTPPPVAINLTATDPNLSAVLHTVIVFQGPGSWKRSAYWDEYVFTLANYGSTPMTITEIELSDFTRTAALPGDNPWALEKQSRSQLQRLQAAAGTSLKVGAATVVVATASAAPFAAAGVFAATPAMAALVVVATPAFLVSTVVRNSNHRKLIDKEFTRRRMVLPLTLAPGEIRQGSLFFRISPGPSRLAVRYRNGTEENGSLDLPLEALASLHLANPVPAWQKPPLSRLPQYPSREKREPPAAPEK